MRAKSPSLKRKVGPGIPPLIVMPTAGFPVMLTSCWEMVSLYSTVTAWACIWEKRTKKTKPAIAFALKRNIIVEFIVSAIMAIIPSYAFDYSESKFPK